MGDYSYCTFEDGWLCMRGLNHYDFPLLLWDALVQTGYGDEVLEYYRRLFEEYVQKRCEVYIDIPSHPMFPDGSPWSTWVIRMTWMMPWRRLLTWRSPSCVRRT
jgi:hypothetical protein